MKRIINWSGLCALESCIRRADKITHYFYFQFCRSSQPENHSLTSPVSTCCYVKHKSSDNWAPLFKSAGGVVQGFLKSLPNLEKTPDLRIPCPSGVDNITKRFTSEEGRINNTDKMVALYELRDFVFQSRVDKPHWDFSTAVETRFVPVHVLSPSPTGAAINQEILNDGLNDPSAASSEKLSESLSAASSGATTKTAPLQPHIEQLEHISNPVSTGQAQTPAEPNNVQNITNHPQVQNTDAPYSRVQYEVGSFVLVRPDSTSANSGPCFWVAKVLAAVTADGESFVRNLKVHWYDERKDSGDHLDRRLSQFYQCYKQTSSKRRKLRRGQNSSAARVQEQWTDVIDTDSVLVSFPSLTKRNTLPLSAQKNSKLEPPLFDSR